MGEDLVRRGVIGGKGLLRGGGYVYLCLMNLLKELTIESSEHTGHICAQYSAAINKMYKGNIIYISC